MAKRSNPPLQVWVYENTTDGDDNAFMAKCKRHPMWAMKAEPTSDCEDCWLLWSVARLAGATNGR